MRKTILKYTETAGPGRRRLAAAWYFVYPLYILYIFVYTVFVYMCIYFDIFQYILLYVSYIFAYMFQEFSMENRIPRPASGGGDLRAPAAL